MDKEEDQKEIDKGLKLLAKSSMIVFIGIIFSKIFSYAYRLIIARNFGPELYGVFSLAIMISGFFLAFSFLGLQNGLLRYVSFFRGNNQIEKIKYLLTYSKRLLFLMGLISGFLLFLLAETISINIFHNSDLIIFLKFFSITIPLFLFVGIFSSFIKAFEKINWFSFIDNILQNAVKLFFLMLFIFLGFKVNAIIFSYILSILVVLVAFYYICKTKLPEIFNKYSLPKKVKTSLNKEVFSYSWPIMFYGVFIGVFFWIDSFAIGYFKTVAEVGIYNAAIPLASLLFVGSDLFINLFFPLITKELAKKNFKVMEELSKQVGKWIFIFNLPILIILLLFPGAVLNLFFGPEYINAAISLRFLALGMFFSSLFLISNNLVSMVGKSKLILFNVIITSILNLFLNMVLVPKYGISGAAFSTMISYIVWGLLFLFQAKHYTSIVPLRRKMSKIFLVSMISAGLLILIKQFIPLNPLAMILQGLIFLSIYSLLIFLTNCLDKNDLMVLKAIKNKLFIKSKLSKTF